MSILIKGMEMPRGCAFCKIARRNGKKMVCPFSGEEWDIHDPMSADHRLADCPLVPVPPHGRLIDARYIRDAIIQKWMDKAGDSHMYKCGMEDAYEVIRNAPTIIEAEEVKEP